jgi:putative ABC transport system permease protein
MIDFSEITRLALRSILRNKTRSILTMLGIIIGVAAVILLVALGTGLQNYITNQFEELGSNIIAVLPGRVSAESGFSQGPPNFAGSKLTLGQTQAIAKLGGAVEDAGAAIEMPAKASYKGKSKYTTVDGITQNYGKLRNLKVDPGRDFVSADITSGRKVAVIGTSVRDALFGASDPLGKEITIGSDRFVVVGILKEIGGGGIGIDVNNMVAIPITAAQTVFGTESVQVITVKAVSKEDIPLAIRQIKSYLGRQLTADDFSVVDQSSLLSTINQVLGVLTTALGGIAAISLVVGGVGIMNIMLVSVTERTREIGLRKAIGAKGSDILTQFIIEAVVLSSLGGTIGILLGVGGALIINRFFPAQASIWSVLLAFGVSAGVGILFGVAPAIKASRLDPIEALRYE